MYVNTEEVFFFLPQCLIHCFLCMPEKWSLPGGEYRRIIVKDHLKIKRPRMKMTHRVYGKPMMTIRKLLFILTALVNAQFLEAQEKHQSYYLHTTFIIHYKIEILFINLISHGKRITLNCPLHKSHGPKTNYYSRKPIIL